MEALAFNEIKFLKILFWIEIFHFIMYCIFPDSSYFLILHTLLLYYWGSIIILFHFYKLNNIVISSFIIKSFVTIKISFLTLFFYLTKRREFSREPGRNNKLLVKNEYNHMHNVIAVNYHRDGIRIKTQGRIVIGQILEVLENSLPIHATKLLVRWATIDKDGFYQAGLLVIK